MSIGFNQLGKLGRLGNQMFQYASLRGIASHRGFDFQIPPSNFKDEWKDHQLLNAFKMKKNINISKCNGHYIKESHFHFDKNLFDHMPDGHNLLGYFQTSKYFEHIEEEIRKDFLFKRPIYKSCNKLINSLDDPIALHVRRGDYLQNFENHPPCPKEYYDNALSKFDKSRTVIIFSDDPEWCKSEFLDDRFIISEEKDNLKDLCTMSLCTDFIIANSSFSWWGSWLSQNLSKKIIAPKRWFGTGYTAAHDTSDLYCDNWEVI